MDATHYVARIYVPKEMLAAVVANVGDRELRFECRRQLESLLEECQIKLSSVVSDLLGASGQRILRAIAAGETIPTAAIRKAIGLCLPVSGATLDGSPKMPLPTMMLTISAVRLQRPIARTTFVVPD